MSENIYKMKDKDLDLVYFKMFKSTTIQSIMNSRCACQLTVFSDQ